MSMNPCARQTRRAWSSIKLLVVLILRKYGLESQKVSPYLMFHVAYVFILRHEYPSRHST